MATMEAFRHRCTPAVDLRTLRSCLGGEILPALVEYADILQGATRDTLCTSEC